MSLSKNYKLMLSTTSEIQAPPDVIQNILKGVKAGSPRTIRKEFSKIMSYDWYIPYDAYIEAVFNSEKVGLMSNFLSSGKISIRHVAPELRNTDFAAFAIKPVEFLTWAAFPEPKTQLSPTVTAVTLYATLSNSDVRRINADCRRNNVQIRLLY